VTGETREFTVCQDVSSRDDGFEVRTIHEGKVDDKFCFIIENQEQLDAHFATTMNETINTWLKNNAQERLNAAAKVLYEENIQPVLLKNGFDTENDEYLFRVFSEITREFPEKATLLTEMVNTDYASAGQFRKTMRSLLTTAKEYAREQYPQEYREADEKEDFYNDFITDIAENVCGEL